MAIISTKGVYGLTAIMILAKQKDQQLLQIKDIASKGDIPQNYLEQIIYPNQTICYIRLRHQYNKKQAHLC